MAFDRTRWAELARSDYKVAPGALVVGGFDGSVSEDYTALVLTEVATGHQWPAGIWAPELNAKGEWEIDVAAVDAAVEDVFRLYNVWRLNADPFYWMEQLAAWAGRYNRPGREVVVSWRTTELRRMALALLDYRTAITAGEVTHNGDPRFAEHMGNARKHMQSFVDDNGERMWTISKDRQGSPFKIDAAMAGCLSWRARLEAIAGWALADARKAGWFFV